MTIPPELKDPIQLSKTESLILNRKVELLVIGRAVNSISIDPPIIA